MHAAQNFSELLQLRQPNVTLRLVPNGGHTMLTWRLLLPPMLQWMTRGLAADDAYYNSAPARARRHAAELAKERRAREHKLGQKTGRKKAQKKITPKITPRITQHKPPNYRDQAQDPRPTRLGFSGGQPELARASGSTAAAPASRSSFAATVMVQPVSMRSSTSSTGPPAGDRGLRQRLGHGRARARARAAAGRCCAAPCAAGPAPCPA